jgi:hypothetical protein
LKVLFSDRNLLFQSIDLHQNACPLNVDGFQFRFQRSSGRFSICVIKTWSIGGSNHQSLKTGRILQIPCPTSLKRPNGASQN